MFVHPARSIFLPIHSVKNGINHRKCSKDSQIDSAAQNALLSAKNPSKKNRKLKVSSSGPTQNLEKDKDFTDKVALTILNLKSKVELGDAKAMHKLSMCYFFGFGVELNNVEGQKLLWKAAKTYAPATNDLGRLLISGESGMPVNPPLGLLYLFKAADDKDPDASMNLGWHYENGDGVTRDLSKALENYTRAKELGASDADAAIERIGLKMPPPSPE